MDHIRWLEEQCNGSAMLPSDSSNHSTILAHVLRPPPPPRADAAPRSRGGDFLSGSFILYKADCHGENVAQCSSLQSLQRMFLPLPWLYVHFAMYVYRILSNEVTL